MARRRADGVIVGPALAWLGPGLAGSILDLARRTSRVDGRIQTPMAIRVRARSGESVEQLQRRFKKLCEKEGLTKDVKRKQYFEKPSERRRRAQRKSANRIAATRGGRFAA
jgi:small subunit ribosomal protein S21